VPGERYYQLNGIRTCAWRNPNYHLNTETKAVLFPNATLLTLPCHEGTDADACTLVGNTRQIAWARSLPVLPSIPQTVLEPVVSQLRSTVFPERQEQNRLNENDQSDLSHIAQRIHHDITGFITSEKAILKASEILFYNFGIEILSPSDLANSATSSDNNDEGLSLSHDGSDLVITKFDEKSRQQTESFLRGQGVTEPEIRKALASGVVDRPRARWLVTHASDVKGFSSWGGDELDSHRVIYLVIDELFPLAQKLIDHFIEKVINSLPSSKITLLALYTTIGNDLTRKTAIDRGFRKNSTENLAANASRYDLIKISYKGYVTNTSWQEFREAISQSIELCLPERMPTFDEFVYTGAVITSKAVQGIVKLPLFEMETIFSPTVFLCVGRGAIIVPIKKPYVDRLLAVANNQLSLLPSNEALLHVEKAYFRSTRNAKMFQRGELLLFYVSGKDGGQEIVGHGRITSSQVINVEAAILQLQRQGALKEQGLHDLSDSDGNIHAITFDNFCFFRHPIPYLFLKHNLIISGANLVTAEKIDSKHLIRLINEGEPHE